MSNAGLATGKNVGSRIRRVGGHKYQADLPDPLWDQLQYLADTNHTTVADLLRRFAKLGILAAGLEESGGELILRRDGHPDERIIILV